MAVRSDVPKGVPVVCSVMDTASVGGGYVMCGP